jgi:hypothetical protein
MPSSEYISGSSGFPYIINAMLIFSIMGMGIKMFFGNTTSTDGSYGRANATIWGYGVVALSIITVMFVSFAIHDRIGKIEKLQDKSISAIFDFVKSFLSSSMPSILTVIILSWIITLNISYFKRINKGQVATEYYQLSAGTSFLFIFQIVCLFQYLKIYISIKTNPTDKNAAVNQSRIAFATYFIAALNLIITGMMTIILQFFSTDG